MSREFQVDNHTYRVEPLSTFDSFDIARRVAPVITMLVMQKNREKLQEGFARAFVSLSSGITREDGQAILTLCMARVSRQDQVGFAPIMAAGKMMYEDIGMEQLLQLLWHVLLLSKIIDFFDVPVSSSKGQAAGQKLTS
jgi:hypothetical protein